MEIKKEEQSFTETNYSLIKVYASFKLDSFSTDRRKRD